MRIAILTSGVLPIPAVQGGAVENLIDFCLEYNDYHHLHDITIYSIFDNNVKNHHTLLSKVNHYHYIRTTNFISKTCIYLFRLLYGDKGYYRYTVEYYLEQAIKHIRKQQYDIILIENRPGFILKIKVQTTAQIVIHQENDYINNEIKGYQEIYDSASLIINTSQYITKRVMTINPNDKKCRTVHNGIDTMRFYQAYSFDRQEMGVNDSDFIIVFSGRLTKDKGILQLIQAIKQVQEIPNIKLLIIGASAYGKDKQPTSFIKQLEIESEPIKDKVVLTGFINYDQVPSYLKMADIAVVPSMWEEPFGLTVVEAMASGLPLITTRSGGIPEICEGVATIVDRENIVENLANAILDLYKHPEKRAAMAKASLERSKLFDKETYAKNFFAALESIQ